VTHWHLIDSWHWADTMIKAISKEERESESEKKPSLDHPLYYYCLTDKNNSWLLILLNDPVTEWNLKNEVNPSHLSRGPANRATGCSRMYTMEVRWVDDNAKAKQNNMPVSHRAYKKWSSVSGRPTDRIEWPRPKAVLTIILLRIDVWFSRLATQI
jgi:hypothetical protein